MNRAYITKKAFGIEIASYFLILLSFLAAIVLILTADGSIPYHYDFSGQPDEYGSPWILLLLPGIMAVTNIVLTLSIHVLPENMWNFPIEITDRIRFDAYKNTAYMIVLLQFQMALYTIYFTLVLAKGDNYIIAGTVVLLVAVFGTIGVYIARIIKLSHK